MKKALGLLLVILIPLLAIVPLLDSGYFTMHDRQHIVRLFLLDKGIGQGYLLPRWVDGLGFGYGYPLFNFYPPLIYYVAEIFVLLGFSLIASVKIMLVIGFVLGALGAYLYLKLLFNRLTAYLGAVFYTYTLYHAVLVYVRGAWAEFFSLGIFPFVVYFLHSLILKPSWRSVIGLSVSLGALMVSHPLIAFPSVIFIGFYVVLAIFTAHDRLKTLSGMVWGGLSGALLSAWFWLPSLMEKQFSLVDDILTKELYNYHLHYVYPSQLYFSPWGFGGSVEGTGDGMSFQIGKYFLFFAGLSMILSLIYLWINKDRKYLVLYAFIGLLTVLSYFMTTPYSGFIWDRIQFLWYLQFPWRFLSFGSFYLSLFAALSVYLVPRLLKNRWLSGLSLGLVVFMALLLVNKYRLLFRPQATFDATDSELTTDHQIRWAISRTSFEFVPKGVKTVKNEYGVSTLPITQKTLPGKSYDIKSGRAEVRELSNRFEDKEFQVKAATKAVFQLNTFAFRGWKAYLNGRELPVDDSNDLKLIRVSLPEGNHRLVFRFADTWPRRVGEIGFFLGLAGLVFSKAGVSAISRQKRP